MGLEITPFLEVVQMKMIDRLIIKEKSIKDILPPFKRVGVYAIVGAKTKIDIAYYSKKDYTLDQVQHIIEGLTQ